MTLTRSEALSFLNKLATDSRPVLGFSLSAWGFSMFVGSIVDIKPDYFTVHQGGGGVGILCVAINDETTFQYGDVRELSDKLSEAQKQALQTELSGLQKLIAGGMALEFNHQTEVVILIEFNEIPD